MRYALALALALCASPVAAQDPLEGIEIKRESRAAFDRGTYGGWIGGCLDTRDQVLIEESVIEVTIDDCRVTEGEWHDPFTGWVILDPGILDIDHFVPLEEANQSGGHRWLRARKKQYANDRDDPDHLVAVHRSANRSKGARDPAEWLPTNEAFHCEYVRRWVSIKRRNGLSMDPSEAEFVGEQLEACEGE